MAAIICKTDTIVLLISVYFIIYRFLLIKNFIDTISEIQSKTMKKHFSLNRLEKIKKPDSPKYCQGCRAIETFIHFW